MKLGINKFKNWIEAIKNRLDTAAKLVFDLKTGVTKLVYKKYDSKYFRLRIPDIVCVAAPANYY